MEVSASRPPGLSDTPDALPLEDQLPLPDPDRVQMGVAGGESEPVADQYEVAEVVAEADICDDAALGRPHPRADRGGIVDSVVHLERGW